MATLARDHRSRRSAAASVVIATGTTLKTLGIPAKSSCSGKGVSHCASCDAPLLRGRIVGVVGGGDSALQEALTLAPARRACDHPASRNAFSLRPRTFEQVLEESEDRGTLSARSSRKRSATAD
jgi:thioredoxin reductase